MGIRYEYDRGVKMSVYDAIYKIIEGHCCRGCDGYNCPNDGAGTCTEVTTNLIAEYIVENLEVE
jgi:hypothetical protein